jgi:hypothetical protein
VAASYDKTAYGIGRPEPLGMSGTTPRGSGEWERAARTLEYLRDKVRTCRTGGQPERRAIAADKLERHGGGVGLRPPMTLPPANNVNVPQSCALPPAGDG